MAKINSTDKASKKLTLNNSRQTQCSLWTVASSTMLPKLLQFSLFNGPNPLSSPIDDNQWQLLFDESKHQAVTALLYDALLKLPPNHLPNKKILFRFTSSVQTIENDNRIREKALLDFANFLTTKKILTNTTELLVVKGSAQAKLYPEPLHRECGDNDLYTGNYTENIANIIENQGIFVERKDPRHISFFFENVNFECHNYLLYNSDDPSWTSMPLVLDNSCTQLSQLTPELAAFFLAKHTEHHAVFFHQPVRLRDLVDWSLLLSSDNFNHKEFSNIKQKTDVDIFANLMSAYCNKLFGLELPAVLSNVLSANDFEKLYMYCPPRHRLAAVRVLQRSLKYLRFQTKYKAVYGQSMFRRFYLKNLKTALKNKLKRG